MKKLTVSLLAALGVAGTSFGGTCVVTKEYKQPVCPQFFRDQEVQFDVFYSYNDAEHTGRQNRRSESTSVVDPVTGNVIEFNGNSWEPQYFADGSGGGVGMNFFFARYFGIGVEGNWWDGTRGGLTARGTTTNLTTGETDSFDRSDSHKSVAHQVTGSLIFRYPIEMCTYAWAPYLFGGGGGLFDGKSSGFGHVGLGAELRFSERVGIFSDWRWNFVGGSGRGDVNTSRAGIRFAF